MMPARPLPAVTVLQPILSGDPGLEPNLLANLDRNPNARFLWLIDDDDPAAQRIAQRSTAANLTVLSGPGPVRGENPKLAKLARALPQVETPVTVVLDDDTAITAGELARLVDALETCDLATGLPVFTADRTPWERLVGGFVNGNAPTTYFAAAETGVQRTINGMIYACRTDTLRALGGFAAIREHLTDDYAIAVLFERGGKRISQAPVFVEVRMTIATAGHYGRVMRRWLIFANRYLKQNANPKTLLLVGLPSILPLVGLLAAVSIGPAAGAAWVALLFARAEANRRLVCLCTGRRGSPANMIAEVAAGLLLPLFYAASLVRPARLTWRTRRIEISNGAIEYQKTAARSQNRGVLASGSWLLSPSPMKR
jgi:ceramide glucosyltransferase